MADGDGFSPHRPLREVLDSMLPAFRMVRTEASLRAINVAGICTLSNSIKRCNGPVWNDDDKLKDWNLIHGKETYEDMRVNLIIVGEAGSGKTSLMAGMASINPYTSVFRKSSPNYDQMIGSTEKWQAAGEWHYERFPGELASDMFLMDEILSVYMTDTPENKKVRELLRSALSRIGTNRITKPQVRVPETQQINYFPECLVVQGFQPRKVPLHIVTDGDLRRAQVINIDFPVSEKKKTKRFGAESPPEGDVVQKEIEAQIKSIKDYLVWLRSHKYDFWIKPSVEKYIGECMEELDGFTRMQGWKARHYFSTAYLDIESRLIRFAIISATVQNADNKLVTVEVENVKEAMRYFGPAYADTLVWINNWTMGTRADISGLSDKDIERGEALVDYLLKRNACDFATTPVSSTEVKRWMVKSGWFGNENGTKRLFQNLLGAAILRSRKRGSEYVCWIGPKGMALLDEKDGLK